MKVLITDGVHGSLINGLEKLGYTVDYIPGITLEEVHNIIKDYEGLVVNTKINVTKSMLDKAINLKVVARLGSGKEILDLEELSKRKIKVITTPEANCNAVAEHALGMLLSLVRNIPKSDFELKNYVWKREENRGYEVSGLRFGILGYGHTGSRFCRLLSSFGCEILVYDPYIQEPISESYVRQVESITELLDCDIISLHISMLPQNYHLINAQFIGMMKNPFFVINTSRGSVIELAALIDGLSSGKIRGACLDVFENEKTDKWSTIEKENYSKLYQFKNTILTPHIAGWTHESKQQIAESILRNWS